MAVEREVDHLDLDQILVWRVTFFLVVPKKTPYKIKIKKDKQHFFV